MPPMSVVAVAALVGALYLGGNAAYQHGIKPAIHATTRAAKVTGCTAEKVFTIGHKHCAPKQKKGN